MPQHGQQAWTIRRETDADERRIALLTEAGFGPGRYAKSAYRLREGVRAVAELGFVAVEDGILRGSVRFWPVTVGSEPSLLLGPLAVQTDQRGRGIGISLMQRGLHEAEQKGYRSVILVGDLPYYGRVGFGPVKHGSIKFPGPVDPARILGFALVDGALDTLEGIVKRARIDEPVCADGAAVG